MVNACYLWAMLSAGAGLRAADRLRIFLQAGRGGKPTLRLKGAGGRTVEVLRIDDPPAHWQLSLATVL
jgi:hypothetical protein